MATAPWKTQREWDSSNGRHVESRGNFLDNGGTGSVILAKLSNDDDNDNDDDDDSVT